jgi:methionine-rich copper-binding protein CopC
MDKSFLLLFFKKEALSSCPSKRKCFFFEKKKQKTFVLLVLAAMLVAPPAWGNAHLKQGLPGVGAVLGAAPEAVVVEFTEALQPKASQLEVFDAAGQRMDKQDAQPLGTDDTRLRVGLDPLKPGTYRVVWRVVAVDGHETDGSYFFTISP